MQTECSVTKGANNRFRRLLKTIPEGKTYSYQENNVCKHDKTKYETHKPQTFRTFNNTLGCIE